MSLILSDRDMKSTERMDDPDCDRNELNHTYRQFCTINSMISGWKKIYKNRIKPVLSKKDNSYSLLDIGFGGGDIPLKLAGWAGEDHIKLNITAIETDRRALEFIQKIDTPDNVNFEYASPTALATAGKKFDVVISNHLLHHLQQGALQALLKQAKNLSTKLVLFNDIKRSDLGYLLFNLFSRPVFRSSFITDDGLTSIKRSYTFEELKKEVPSDWKIHQLFPFRLLLTYEHMEKNN